MNNMFDLKKLANKVAVITGSASGLGFELAIECQNIGMHVVLTDIRKNVLKDFFEQNRKLEIKNIKHKFRHKEQFLIQGIANHIEIKNKSCVMLQDYQLVNITSYKRKIIWLYFKLHILTNKQNIAHMYIVL